MTDLNQYETLEKYDELYGEWDDAPAPKKMKKATRTTAAKAVTAATLSDAIEERTGPFAAFYLDELIVGEPIVVKSGKEATVYCCEAHPRIGKRWLAAKFYRPRQNRSFKNDAVYQQGRTTFNTRTDRAIATKTNFGREAQFSTWIDAEYATLRSLYAGGADVPQAYARSENVLLMDYFGERGMAAPQLMNVELQPQEVGPLFEQVLHNLEIMLERDRVHGDLSAYNILYWEGKLQIIDFPQAVDPMDNTSAYGLFVRDLQNVYEYFQLYGVQCHVERLARTLWIESGRANPPSRVVIPE